jgi:hypothetical protein
MMSKEHCGCLNSLSLVMVRCLRLDWDQLNVFVITGLIFVVNQNFGLKNWGKKSSHYDIGVFDSVPPYIQV